MVDFKQWQELDLRIGKVVTAEHHPDADKLIVMQVDLGTESRQIVAGIRQWYDPAVLVGRLIVVIANLEPAKLRGVWSQGMLLAASDASGKVVILTPDGEVAPGSKVS
jgi:methionine--tRNA ligase beta chain